MRWNRVRFHLIPFARTGDRGSTGHDATRASFPPRREDRRQTPRGGLGGLGDLEDEDRRHLAVLVAAGARPPVYNGLLPVDRSDADGIGISALSVYESGTPPSP